jgi:hypothetical protein
MYLPLREAKSDLSAIHVAEIGSPPGSITMIIWEAWRDCIA